MFVISASVAKRELENEGMREGRKGKGRGGKLRKSLDTTEATRLNEKRHDAWSPVHCFLLVVLLCGTLESKRWF